MLSSECCAAGFNEFAAKRKQAQIFSHFKSYVFSVLSCDDKFCDRDFYSKFYTSSSLMPKFFNAAKKYKVERKIKIKKRDLGKLQFLNCTKTRTGELGKLPKFHAVKKVLDFQTFIDFNWKWNLIFPLAKKKTFKSFASKHSAVKITNEIKLVPKWNVLAVWNDEKLQTSLIVCWKVRGNLIAGKR